MHYHEYLLTVLKGDCPFCNVKKEYILEKGKYFTVLLARAPYTEDHVLIIPNRHIIRSKEISDLERESVIKIIKKWTKKLEKIHKEVNLLLRDGVANGISGKSIDHLHFHLIPDCAIYAKSCEKDRNLYSDYMLAKKTKNLKSKLKISRI